MRRFPESEVCWGETLCEAPSCFALAELLSDYGRGAGVPVCLDCAGRLLERDLAALALGRRVADLPALFAGAEGRRPAAGLSDWEIAHRTPELWLAEQGFYGEQTDPETDPDWDIPF